MHFPQIVTTITGVFGNQLSFLSAEQIGIFVNQTTGRRRFARNDCVSLMNPLGEHLHIVPRDFFCKIHRPERNGCHSGLHLAGIDQNRYPIVQEYVHRCLGQGRVVVVGEQINKIQDLRSIATLRTRPLFACRLLQKILTGKPREFTPLG